MALSFVTGNANKFSEMRTIIPDIEQLDLDLEELQEIDPEAIVRHKLEQARPSVTGAFIVEDVSLSLDCMNGLPGPLVKWFLRTIGAAGIYRIAESYGEFGCEARATIGYSDETGGVHLFSGMVRGTIVEPEATSKFGWDPIFKPEGFEQTYAQMPFEEKNKISHRRRAAEQLKAFLESQ